MIDLPRTLGALADLLVNRSYNFSLRHGLLWNRIGVGLSYRLDWSRLGKLMARAPAKRVGGFRVDTVVFTTPWLVERVLDGLNPRCTAHAVILDLAPPLSPGWSCAGIARVYAPTEEARRGLGGRGTVLGVPVFPPTAGDAVAVCESCDGAPSVLVTGGRSGYAGLPALVRALSERRGLHITALTGTDPRFRATIERNASRAFAHVDVRPFAPDVLPLIAAHDVVLAKPGTMTIGEVLAHGRPLLLDASQGLMPQEVGNARFVENRHAGLVVRSPPQALEGLERLLVDPSFAAASRSLSGIAGVERIAAAILKEA